MPLHLSRFQRLVLLPDLSLEDELITPGYAELSVGDFMLKGRCRSPQIEGTN